MLVPSRAQNRRHCFCRQSRSVCLASQGPPAAFLTGVMVPLSLSIGAWKCSAAEGLLCGHMNLVCGLRGSEGAHQIRVAVFKCLRWREDGGITSCVWSLWQEEGIGLLASVHMRATTPRVWKVRALSAGRWRLVMEAELPHRDSTVVLYTHPFAVHLLCPRLDVIWAVRHLVLRIWQFSFELKFRIVYGWGCKLRIQRCGPWTVQRPLQGSTLKPLEEIHTRVGSRGLQQL